MNKAEETVFKEFDELKPQLIKWGLFVDNTLMDEILTPFIKDNSLKINPSYRVKDPRTYLFKALYRKKPYIQPILEIEDKIGTRIVMLKSSDVDKVEKAILSSDKWKSKTSKSIKQEINDKPSIFDYQSVHIIVNPSDSDTNFADEIKPLLTCEIQIRTLLQHAFAEVSHDSTYKGPYKNDKGILRHLAKSMALMEATDDYFCNIFELMTDEKRYFHNYLNELIGLFKTFDNLFERSDLDHDLTETILNLIETQPVELSSISFHVEKYKAELLKVIKAKNGLLFKQPIYLLVSYYFYEHKTFLKDNWPLSFDTLKSIFQANNTSFEDY